MQTKLKYALSCLPLRNASDEGENTWQSLMADAKRISMDDFAEMVDLETILDEDETLDDFVCSDGDHGFYLVEDGDTRIAFLQHSGHEFFFTESGLTPTYIRPLDTFAKELAQDLGGARTLLDANDARIAGAYGLEYPAVDLEYDLDQILVHNSDCQRFRLYRDGEAVAGLRIDEEGVIDQIYVAYAHRRKGLATELLNRAEEYYGEIQHSDVLTPDGKAFRESFQGVKRQHDYDEYDSPSM